MTSATDIITYIGIPLAVLSTLPILYTFIRSLLLLRSIRRTLTLAGFQPTHALVRGSLISGIIELELPHFTITPLDRSLDTEYWKLNSNKSGLSGGSWTVFHWNKLVTGTRLYRVQYKDELRQPQAEVGFAELVEFLMDWGAVPDGEGWGMLRGSGLWTPTGTPLLRSPGEGDGEGKGKVVLRVAVPDDSNGVLSLEVSWEGKWDGGRGVGSLPPGWLRLKQPGVGRKREKEGDAVGLVGAIEGGRLCLHGTEGAPSESVRFRVEDERVERIYFEHRGIYTGVSQEMLHADEPGSLWFVCAAWALGQHRKAGLWNFSMSPQILSFAWKESMPCGVMVLLGIIAEIDSPVTWSSPDEPRNEAMRHHQRFVEQQRKIAVETAMLPEQAAAAKLARESEYRWAMHDDMMASMNARRERDEKRMKEALTSTALSNRAVAEANLAWLVDKKEVPQQWTIEQLVEAVLYLMVVNKGQASMIADILDRWLAWSQSGGMNKQHLTFLTDNKIAFCYASSLVCIIQDTSSAEGRVSTNMQECMKLWRKVRLG